MPTEETPKSLRGINPTLESALLPVSQSSCTPAKESLEYLAGTLPLAHLPPILAPVLLVEVLPILQSPGQIPKEFIQNSSLSPLVPSCTLLISFITYINILLILWVLAFSCVSFCFYIEHLIFDTPPKMSSFVIFIE